MAVIKLTSFEEADKHELHDARVDKQADEEGPDEVISCLLAVVQTLCLRIGIRREPVRSDKRVAGNPSG